MAWRKSPPALIVLFDRCLPPDPRVERRQMFGYPAAFVQGRMFAGLFEDKIVLKLDEMSRQQAIDEEGAVSFEPMPGRTMKPFILVPASIEADEAVLTTWLARGLAFVASLPPKAKRTARKRKA